MPKHESFVRERPFEDIEIGESFSVTKGISEADVVAFAGICGDFNPLHLNEAYAKTTPFGKRIAHGMLTASFISTCIGCGIPGLNTIYMSQELRFEKPVFIGDIITARLEVLEKFPEKRRVLMSTTVTNQDGVTVLSGKALVKIMEKEPAE